MPQRVGLSHPWPGMRPVSSLQVPRQVTLQASPQGTLQVLSAPPGCMVPEDRGLSHLLPFSSCHSGPDPHCSCPRRPLLAVTAGLSGLQPLGLNSTVSSLPVPGGPLPALSAHPVVVAPCPCPPSPRRGRCPSLAVACPHPLTVGCGGVAGQGPLGAHSRLLGRAPAQACGGSSEGALSRSGPGAGVAPRAVPSRGCDQALTRLRGSVTGHGPGGGI